MTSLRAWDTPHLMTLASGSEAHWWTKRITLSEKLNPFFLDVFDDPEGSQVEGES